MNNMSHQQKIDSYTEKLMKALLTPNEFVRWRHEWAKGRGLRNGSLVVINGSKTQNNS